MGRRRGLYIGYRRGARSGTWWLCEYRDGKLLKRCLGEADSESLAADGLAVLSWQHVNERAIAPMRPTTQPAGHYAVRQSLEDYFRHRVARSPPESVAADRIKAAPKIPESIAGKPVDALTPGLLDR